MRNISLPPPLIFLICAGVMYLLPKSGEFYFSRLIITLLILMAIGISILSLWQFHRANTTINPLSFEKTTQLVTTGIFRMSRNPMYVSLWLLLLSWFLWLGNSIAILGLIFFVWIINELQIKREEQVLSQKFGKQYEYYCQKVRRWL